MTKLWHGVFWSWNKLSKKKEFNNPALKEIKAVPNARIYRLKNQEWG